MYIYVTIVLIFLRNKISLFEPPNLLLMSILMILNDILFSISDETAHFERIP